MYTRTYPQKEAPLPENYGGTALLREEETVPRDAPAVQESTGEDGGTKQEANGATLVSEPPSEREGESGETEGRAGTGEDSLATGDLLLLAMAALLVQSESPDNELLLLLFLLLLH